MTPLPASDSDAGRQACVPSVRRATRAQAIQRTTTEQDRAPCRHGLRHARSPPAASRAVRAMKSAVEAEQRKGAQHPTMTGAPPVRAALPISRGTRAAPVAASSFSSGQLGAGELRVHEPRDLHSTSTSTSVRCPVRARNGVRDVRASSAIPGTTRRTISANTRGNREQRSELHAPPICGSTKYRDGTRPTMKPSGRKPSISAISRPRDEAAGTNSDNKRLRDRRLHRPCRCRAARDEGPAPPRFRDRTEI